MLSLILSRSFAVGFIVVLIIGLAAIAGQVFQKSSPDLFGRWGKPGLWITARRNITEERATDTTIIFLLRDSSGIPTAAGSVHLPDNYDVISQEKLNHILATKRKDGETLYLDTNITFIGHVNEDIILENPPN